MLSRETLLLWLTALTIGLVAFLLRALFLNRSYDIFIDEITYLRIAQSVETTRHVSLYGQPFFLHPPAFFYLEAAYLKLTQPVGSTLDLVHAVRYLNVFLSATSAVILFVIGRRIAGWAIGVTVALLHTFDPFIISINSLNLLDTSAMFWVLCGYAVLLYGFDASGREGAPTARRQVGREIVVGLFFGLALLTKDMTAFLTLAPLAVLFVFRWTLSRSSAAFIAAVTCFPYLLYPLTLIPGHDRAAFFATKLHGVSRLAGAVQETGFKHASGGGTSLATAVAKKLVQYGTTYTIILLGIGAVVLLLLRGKPLQRIVGVWTACAYALLIYCVAFGTLEEQFFYLLVVPALLALGAAAHLLLTDERFPSKIKGLAKPGLIGAAALFVLWSTGRWAVTHLQRGDGYTQVLAYVAAKIPPADRHIAATDETAQFLLGDASSAPWGSWDAPSALRASGASYVVVSPEQTIWDHGRKGLALIVWIKAHGRAVFTFHGANGDSATLYKLKSGSDARATQARQAMLDAPPPGVTTLDWSRATPAMHAYLKSLGSRAADEHTRIWQAPYSISRESRTTNQHATSQHTTIWQAPYRLSRESRTTGWHVATGGAPGGRPMGQQAAGAHTTIWGAP